MDKLTAKETKLQELFKDTELEDLDFIGFDSAEDLIDNMNTQIDETEVIYYNNTIKYLSENDASLHDSLEIAEEMGYAIKDLSSEILATLLQQSNLRLELSRLTSDIEDIYNED